MCIVEHNHNTLKHCSRSNTEQIGGLVQVVGHVNTELALDHFLLGEWIDGILCHLGGLY